MARCVVCSIQHFVAGGFFGVPNQDWFRETFDRYAGELVSYARILLRDVDDLRSYAEDSVQMAFLQLCANQHAVREHENIEAWLKCVVKNRIADDMRKLQMRFRRLGMPVDMEELEKREARYRRDVDDGMLAGEAEIERSCVHRIEYAYRVDDMRVGWWWADKVSNFPMTLSILLWVTDSGVDEAYGRAVSFAPCVEVARADILAQDAIADLAQSSTLPELMYLPIEQDEKEVLRPAWVVLVDMGTPHEYDAFTGEELLNGWDALPQ